MACSLLGQTMPVHLTPGSLAAAAYAAEKTTERYYCQYGVADRYRDQLSTTGLAVTGRDGEGEPRIVERSDHPFFVATLFVPQASSSPTAPHPLVRAFVAAADRATTHDAPAGA